MTVEINEALARKVLEVVDAGLVNGMGSPEPGKMCVEAAVNYAMGAPHGDQPACVAPALRKLKIRLNDALWSSDEARTAGLRRLAIAQLGSAGALDEVEFAKRVATLAIRVSVPEALRAAAKLAKGERQIELLRAAVLCESDPTRANVESARKTAYAAYTAAAAYAAYTAAAAYAAYTAYTAAYAAYTAYTAYTAAAAADAAADAAAAAADAAAARDKSLAAFCEEVVKILIDMKAPGCQWLWMTEAA